MTVTGFLQFQVHGLSSYPGDSLTGQILFNYFVLFFISITRIPQPHLFVYHSFFIFSSCLSVSCTPPPHTFINLLIFPVLGFNLLHVAHHAGDFHLHLLEFVSQLFVLLLLVGETLPELHDAALQLETGLSGVVITAGDSSPSTDLVTWLI